MGSKDIVEKTLEGYNDVFADIVNVLLFGGKQLVNPDDLEDQLPRSVYKADGNIHEMERDVVKRWKKRNIRIACIGMENQTIADPYMTLRVGGYDGSEYRAQMIRRDEQRRNEQPMDVPYPVITLVLYFGYEKQWKAPRTLYEALDIPEELKPYVNDIRLNLFEIAWLTDEQVGMFQSDFRIVADYFVQMRKNRDYDPGRDVAKHIEAVMDLLKVMDQDYRFELQKDETGAEEVPKTMSEWLTRKLGESENKGKAEGVSVGEDRLASLISRLSALGRNEDILKVADNKDYREKLYAELGIA
ncbi:MAG: Rpn family recombination-promoting nuclease/putative transposase [Clostridia bacterium]|nr:Rpn family recombination-promoting nuclease/putative transposase [Clostridia bacterium]